jgi:hypothetical protein
MSYMDCEDEVNRATATGAPAPLPETPAEGASRCGRIGLMLEPASVSCLIEQLAPLVLIPEYQPFTLRVDWAIRLTLSFAGGTESPRPRDCEALLNDFLAEADVLRREDPPEDLFAGRLLTPFGEVPLLNGGYGTAAGLTQLVYDAFTSLPASSARSEALVHVSALLRLAAIIAERSFADGHGERVSRSDRILVPPALARVRFTQAELSEAGISRAALEPFILQETARRDLLHQRPGNSILELRPLLIDGPDILVAAPHLIALAIRAHLAGVASRHHIDRPMQRAMLQMANQRLGDFGISGIELKEDEDVDGWRVASALASPAPGRWLHLIHTVEPLADTQTGRFGYGPAASQALRRHIDAQIASAISFAGAQDDIECGLTLWITSGWARGAEIDMRMLDADQNWQAAAVNPIDLGYMGIENPACLQTLWRLARASNQAVRDRIELINLSGFANLYAWWRFNGHSFFPASHPSTEAPLVLQLPFDAIRGLRASGESRADLRARPLPNGRLVRTLKFDREATNHAQDSKYAALDEISAGRLLGGVDLAGQPIWIEAAGEESTPEGKLVYDSWDSALNWLASVLDNEAVRTRLGTPTRSILCRLILQNPGKEFGPPPAREHLPGLIKLRVDIASSQFDLEISGCWHWALQYKDNAAELELATAMLEGVSYLTPGGPLFRSEAATLIRAFAASPQFRWRHGHAVLTPTDQLVADGLMAEPHRIPDCAKAQVQSDKAPLIGLSADISGLEGCLKAAQDYRDACLGQLILAIRPLDRIPLLRTCLDYHQRAIGELRIWDATAAASSATLGRDSDLSVSMINTQHALEMIRASSILAELAACEAGKCGGEDPNPMLVDELLALCIEAFLGGDAATALLNGRGPDHIRTTLDGRVLVDPSFSEQTIRPMLNAYHALRRAEVSSEQSAIESPEHTEKPPANPEELSRVLAAEYGAGLAELRELPFGCSLIAQRLSSPVLHLPASQLASRLKTLGVCDVPNLPGTLRRLTLRRRASYFSALGDLTPRDIDLARFSRPHSLISRPLIQVDDDPDPVLMLAPALVQRSFEFIVTGALSGILQGDFWTSSEMQSYTGKRGSEIGLAFNRQIAEEVRICGLVAFDSVSPTWVTNSKATEVTRRLGDIDVLAVDKDNNRIWVIEAKDLQLCRTQGETARRMSDYQGKLDGRSRPDKLLRHLRRVHYIRENAALCIDRLGLRGAPEVRGLLVVSLPQPISPAGGLPDSKTCIPSQMQSILMTRSNGQ